jgi:hypothetical protein
LDLYYRADAAPPTKPRSKNRDVNVNFYAMGFRKKPVRSTAPVPDPDVDPISEQQRISAESPQFNARDTTTTEFATVNVDSVISEIEMETTQKPSEDTKAFGGLDIIAIFRAFFSGFFG